MIWIQSISRMSQIFLLNHESVQVLDAFWVDFFFMIDSMINKIALIPNPTIKFKTHKSEHNSSTDNTS